RPRRPRVDSGRGQRDEVLIEGFVRRLLNTGASEETRGRYAYQLRRLLSAGRRHRLGTSADLIDLFQDESMLGAALVDDRSEGRVILSRWTLAQRRAAVRSFARLMAPELRAYLSTEPEEIVMRALQCVGERVGGGYRLTGGMPRRRGGRVPTPDEVSEIIAA